MTPIAWWFLAGCFPRYPSFPGEYGSYSYTDEGYYTDVDTGWEVPVPGDSGPSHPVSTSV